MSLRHIHLRGALAVSCGALFATLVMGCGGNGATGPATRVHSVVVSPDSVALTSGATESLSAEARDATNKPVSGQTFFWSTSDSMIATVTQTGVVTGRQAGTARIGASAQGTSGFARVVVVTAVVHSVVVTPASSGIYATAPGDAVTLTATSYDVHGNVLAGRPILWSTSSGIVTVSDGTVTGTGVAAGTAVITATSPDPGFPSGSASVTVIGHVASVGVSPSSALLSVTGLYGLPQSVQLQATLTDTFGHDVTGQRAIAWSSTHPAVASVDPQSGLVRAVASSGTEVVITATSPDRQTGKSTIGVFP